MTDNEIIKALECCNHNHTWQKRCFDCEYATFGGNCGNELIKDTLDLINRQRAEIERLNNNMDSMVAEHERLIKNAKSEAIREFAEKLKDVFVTIDGVFECSEIEEHIDNLVKEMVGEDNG